MSTAGITIICPNPAIDRTIAIDRLRRGGDHRARRAAARAGGKGANVARALAATGVGFRLVVPAGGPMGAALRALLAAERLPAAPVAVEGETRSTLAVVDQETVTVLNDPGAALTQGEWERVLAAAADGLRSGGLLVCSGSFPPGLGEPAVRQVVELAHAHGCRALVDSSGAGLTGALAAGADVVFPNFHETVSALGRAHGDAEVEPGHTLAEAAELAPGLCAAGAGAVVLTAGSAGAVVVERERVVASVPAPAIDVLNPVGAGDCLVAGVAGRLAGGASLADGTRWGVALAAASCETFTAAAVDPARARELLQATTDEELPA